MENYTHNIPTIVYFGKGQISHLDSSLRQFGTRVLLVYGGGSIKANGLYDEVMKILNSGGFFVAELSGVEPNPRIESVEKGVSLCNEKNIDVVLAVGGGSTIDCSKAICVGYYYKGNLWDMIKKGTDYRKALPLVDILTTSATGSDFDGGGVITNTKTKEKIGAKLTYPVVSILDPTYTYSVSNKQTAAGAVDILSHVMEGYFCKTDDSDISDGLAEIILKAVIKYLPIALNDHQNYSARSNLMMAESIACSRITEYGKTSNIWTCHSMEHELSAYYDITHGIGLAIITPRWMRYILDKDPGCEWRFVKFSKNVWNLAGNNYHELALKGIEALEQFFKECNIPSTLTELNIGSENFEAMAEHSNIENKMSKTFVPLNTQDIVEIFKACL